MIKNLRKRGFTIVELVIVIAVIAILAAILIPTFSGIIKKANIASDTAMAKNMNTALVMADSEGNVPEDMGDVLFILYEAGYALENLNPTTNGYYFVWDSSTNQILFLTDTFEVHYSSKTYSKDTLDWWMPVDEATDVIEGQKFSYTMADDLSESFTFDYLANFDTNGFILNGNLTYASDATGSYTVKGIINGKLTVTTPNASLYHYGTTENVDIIEINSASYHLYGFVKQVLKALSGRVVVENTGSVKTISVGNGLMLNIENEGIIDEVNVEANNGTTLTETDIKTAAALIVNKGFLKKFSEAVTLIVPKPIISANSTKLVGDVEGFIVKVNNLNELEGFRDSVNGGMTYEGLTISLTTDIDLTGQAWTPIGWTSRKLASDPTMFMGTFEGNNHTIKGLSTSGFTVTSEGIREDNYSGASESNYVFGLFGIAKDAEFSNLKFTNVDIHELGNGYVLDSAAALLGFSVGSLTVKNVTASGTVKGTDGMAGIIGRAYQVEKRYGETHGTVDSVLIIENVVNNINVTLSNIWASKGAGIIGYVAGYDVGAMQFQNCTNNGNITALGYRGAGIAQLSSEAVSNGLTALSLGCVNNGEILDKSGIHSLLWNYNIKK